MPALSSVPGHAPIHDARCLGEGNVAAVAPTSAMICPSKVADYLKRFYGISTELPTHYDIVLNTDHVAPEEAAALILTAARSTSRSAR